MRDGFAQIEQRTNDTLFSLVELSSFRYDELVRMDVVEFFGMVKRVDGKQKAIRKQIKQQNKDGRRNRRKG